MRPKIQVTWPTEGELKSGQRIDPHRYCVLPRTLTFLINKNRVLLLRLAANRGSWAGKLNGLGGHVEKAEDPHSAALREIKEESGITPNVLTLCGLVHIDVGENPGIALYIYVGETYTLDIPIQSSEGIAEWQDFSSLEKLPVVEDLPLLFPKALDAYTSKRPFSAIYHFNEAEGIKINFSE